MAGFWSGNAESGNGQWLDPEHGNATQYDPFNTPRGSIHPETEAALRAMGYQGDMFSDSPEMYGQDGHGASSQLSPEFRAWMQQQGISPAAYQQGNGANLDFTGPNGQIGSHNYQEAMQAPEFMAAAALGLGGVGMMGAGLIPGASPGTFRSQGANALGALPGASGFEAGGYPMGAGGGVDIGAEGALAGNADKAAMFGAEGYGAAASPAERRARPP